MTLVIREAVKNDAALVLSFIQELAEYEKMRDDVVATVRDIENTLFAPAPKTFCLIAEDANGPVGFALYFFNYSTFLGKHGLYLEDLFVRPEGRGKGAGKALLARLAAIAEDNDCGRMEWWVLDWNKPAIDFYKSLNAEEMDEWTVFRLTGAPLKALADEGRSIK